MFEDMDPDDWREWPEYFALEPQGALQDAQYFGLLASLLYNAHRAENAPAKSPEDWFPHLQRLAAERKQSPRRARLLMALQAWKMRGLRTGKPLNKGEASGKQGQ